MYTINVGIHCQVVCRVQCKYRFDLQSSITIILTQKWNVKGDFQMPVQKCTSNGKSGWKYGEQGHCYTGPGAKSKAIKQGLAIQYNGGEKFKGSLFGDDVTDSEIQQVISTFSIAEQLWFQLSDFMEKK